MSEAAVLDPVRRRQVRFFPEGSTRVETLPLDAPGDWTTLTVAGTPPPVRDGGYATTYDPLRDRIVLTGGYRDDPRGHSRQIFNDVWALTLSDPPTWQLLLADGGPIHIEADALFEDAGADRLLGVGNDGTSAGVWTFSPTTGAWTLLRRTPAFFADLLAFDPTAHELLGVQLDTMNAWRVPDDGSSDWIPIALDPARPPARRYARMAYDAPRRRLFVFGGQGIAGVQYVPLDDFWELDLDQLVPVALSLVSADATAGRVALRWWSGGSAGTPATLEARRATDSWSLLAELVSDGEGMFVYADDAVVPGERVGYRLVVHGAPAPASEVWVTVPLRPVLAMAGAQPNPAGESPLLAFSLASAAPARLEVFDLAGRRAESREVGSLGAGAHQLRCAEHLAPGVYVARLTQQGATATARFVVTR